MGNVEIDIDKLIDGYYESDIHQYYQKYGDRASYHAEMTLRNKTHLGMLWSKSGGIKNVKSGHIKKLNNEILTSERRSEAKKIKISKFQLLELQNKFETVKELTNYLKITQNTYRRLCKEYDIYENKHINKTYKVCVYCGIETDLSNYRGFHGDKCIGKKITKDVIQDTHSKFTQMSDIISELGLPDSKTYKRLCNHNNIKPKRLSNKERSLIGSMKTSKSVKIWKVDKNMKDLKGEYLGEFESKSEAARKLNVSRQLIGDTLKGRYKTPTKIIVELS